MDKENKKNEWYQESIELLRKTMKVLAEKSKDCSIDELVAISKEMRAIHNVILDSPCF